MNCGIRTRTKISYERKEHTILNKWVKCLNMLCVAFKNLSSSRYVKTPKLDSEFIEIQWKFLHVII